MFWTIVLAVAFVVFVLPLIIQIVGAFIGMLVEEDAGWLVWVLVIIVLLILIF